MAPSACKSELNGRKQTSGHGKPGRTNREVLADVFVKRRGTNYFLRDIQDAD
jgi:hypothetical protein